MTRNASHLLKDQVHEAVVKKGRTVKMAPRNNVYYSCWLSGGEGRLAKIGKRFADKDDSQIYSKTSLFLQYASIERESEPGFDRLHVPKSLP